MSGDPFNLEAQTVAAAAAVAAARKSVAATMGGTPEEAPVAVVASALAQAYVTTWGPVLGQVEATTEGNVAESAALIADGLRIFAGTPAATS